MLTVLNDTIQLLGFPLFNSYKQIATRCHLLITPQCDATISTRGRMRLVYFFALSWSYAWQVWLVSASSFTDQILSLVNFSLAASTFTWYPNPSSDNNTHQYGWSLITGIVWMSFAMVVDIYSQASSFKYLLVVGWQCDPTGAPCWETNASSLRNLLGFDFPL